MNLRAFMEDYAWPVLIIFFIILAFYSAATQPPIP
jgi:hypothetical protein